MMENSSLIRERDKYLCRCYRKVVREYALTGRILNRREVMREVLQFGRPMYCCGYEHALRRISAIDRGKVSLNGNSMRAKMWREIYGKVQKMRARFPGRSTGEIVQKLLADERASRFFITMKYAFNIIYRYENGEIGCD